MIFSKMVDEIHTKFFEMHVKYSVAMKRSFYSSDLLPISSEIPCSFSKTLTKLVTILTKEAMIFSEMVD